MGRRPDRDLAVRRSARRRPPRARRGRRAARGCWARMPAGYRPIVVDNGSTDGSADDRARPRRARRARAAARASAPPASPGCSPRPTDVVCFMDCDGSLDPRDLPRVAEPVARRRRRPRARRARAEPGAWPLHARAGQPGCSRSSCAAAPGVALRDLGPMRAARRAALLALGHRRPPLRLAAGDGAARRGRRLADRRGRRSPTGRARAARR